MKLVRLALLSAATLGAFALSAHAAVPDVLQSPWDPKPVKVKAGDYACTIPGALTKDITAYDYYSDAQHSKIDPKRYAAYQSTQEQFRAVTSAAIKAADTFQSSGRQGAADCVLHILLAQAQAGAMTGAMASNQSYYVQGWTIGALAVTWLKVRTASPGTPDEQKAVTDWLDTVGKSTKQYFTDRRAKGTTDAQNNHYQWAGFAVLSAGVAANDHKLFDWGVDTYKDGVARIQPDGTLPLEMDRGQKALHYHLFALAPFVTIAEFGAVNGLDLYGMNHNALARLIDRSVAGLADNTYFAAKAKSPQDTPADGKIKSDDVLFLTPYNRRFPSPAINGLLHSVEPRPYPYLGGLPPS